MVLFQKHDIASEVLSFPHAVEHHVDLVCVCVCMRACVRGCACVCVCWENSLKPSFEEIIWLALNLVAKAALALEKGTCVHCYWKTPDTVLVNQFASAVMSPVSQMSLPHKILDIVYMILASQDVLLLLQYI